ncbi:putative O-glycosylation ligase, exosortase A system-associated [Roseomonas haemaphysalidis]|uniref:O-glycosylation ligase, exosortase A system-associated n=1 Tax=Roseomonas haemaphysalidis TaxID=2768162 RepID=A0ABS3KNR0_9PROT|nr:putative O-glycosylation ligase, exosortase A system-associated [Roseomonas haemaphysalidis]MBO1079091.1 putative O-glycosylation ligase, exosortase A system-associated [Roseomonas haemaphysalidis]
MRDAVFMLAMVGLLPIVIFRPFVGILLWSWISFMNPHRLVWGAASEMPWAMAVFAATLLGCLIAREPKRIQVNPVNLLVLALMVCFTITSLTAQGMPDAVWAKWSQVIKVLTGLMLTAALLTERRRVHALVWVMVISLGYYGVRGGGFTILNGGSYRVWGPEQTMINDNNHLAAALLVSLPLMHYLRLQSSHKLVRQGLLVAMVLTLLAVVGSYSRGALLGLLAVSFMMWLRSKQKVVSAVVMVAGLAGAIAFMPGDWGGRMESIGSYQQDESASERLVLWQISAKLAAARPLVGSGFTGPYNRAVVDTVAPGGPARAVHSIWFELLGEQGFPTFFVWVGLTVAGMFSAIRLARITRDREDLRWAHDLGRMGQVSIVAYLVSGTFLSLSYWDYYWTLLVVIGSALVIAKRELAQQPASTLTPAAAVALGGWRQRASVGRRPALGQSVRA